MTAKITDARIIDAHCHLGKHSPFHIPHDGSADALIHTMDRLGIDRICVSSFLAIGADFKRGNDQVLSAVERYPRRIMGYVTLNPHYPEAVVGELERCFSTPGFVGIKLHPNFHGTIPEHEGYREVYEYGDRIGCPILIHTWGLDDVAAVGRLAGKYPNAKFIMGHTGGGEIASQRKGLNTVAEFPNLYADIATSCIYEGGIEWFVEKAGAKKVLFGTDMPFLDPVPNLCRVLEADLSEEDRKDILGRNFLRLIER